MVDVMALSDAERARLYRDRKRGGPPQPRELKPHGTAAAYKRHRRHGETPCDACLLAEAQRQHDLYERRKITTQMLREVIGDG